MTIQPRHERSRTHRRTLAAALGLAVGAISLAGCDDLLEVELPASVTNTALDDPRSAQVQVLGVLAAIECGYSSFIYEAASYEDNFQRIAGAAGAFSEYQATPGGGTCDDDGDFDFDWYEPLQIGRAQAFGVYERLQGWPDGEVRNRERLMVQAALYAAVALDVLGEHFCEMAVDAGPLMTSDATLALAEDWVNKALGHLRNTGDFALPNGISGSAQTMGYALRGRIRWARGPEHWAGAKEDLLRVPQGYTAWVTRETGTQRRNKPYQHTSSAFGKLQGVIDSSIWTNPPAGAPNSFTRQVWNPGGGWPSVIPFTGYLNLGIAPDGRAISSNGIPVLRTAAGAVPDSRVRHEIRRTANTAADQVPLKYSSDDQDLPLLSWRETWLMLAEIEGGRSAIDRVNQLRASRGLPLVTYANPGNADEIENMIIEERRRELWLEGRFWSTKIRNTDKLWFPRAHGSWPTGYGLQGGVRLAMPVSEYELNPNFDLSARGTGCPAEQRPIIIG